MESILGGLNAAQLAAVTSEADVLQILAPPGSGKTSTLTARVAYLLHVRRYQPWNVIVATFTVKAAREMSERIGRMLGGGLEESLILGTFHSIARRYLMRYGQLIGIKPGFGIADSSDSLTIAKRIVKRHTLNIDPSVACNRISHLKARGVVVQEYLHSHPKKTVDVQEFGLVHEEYELALQRSNTLDFNDLLLRCRDLLRDHPHCVSNVEAVLIDEFQDTNVTQFELMTLFAAQRKRISTVGDSDQSIYSFRCAEIKNLQRMQESYPDGLTVHLEENYRSSGAILLSALAVIQQDQSRPEKPLLATHCVGSPPVLRRLPSSAVEGAWIVQEITRMVARLGGLISFKDIALLIRSASLSRPIETALTKSGIPYRICGGRRFFERAEIKILLDYLSVVSLPENSEALARIVNVPPRKIGETTVSILMREAETRRTSLWAHIRGLVQSQYSSERKLTKAAEQGLASVYSLITKARERLRPDSSDPSLVGLIKFLLSKLSFASYLQKAYPEDVDTRQANVDEFLAQALEISSSEKADDPNREKLPQIDGVEQMQLCAGEEVLSQFLSMVMLASEVKPDSAEGDADNKITISTIHAAKGLEWPVVFIPGAFEGSIPHSRAEDADEERRLLYVAMTRAQSLLYISVPTRNSLREEATISPFLLCHSLKGHLINRGPSFDHDIKDAISRVLGRPIPSEAEVDRRSVSLPSLEDDIWPLNGEFPMEKDKHHREIDADGHDARHSPVEGYTKLRDNSRMNMTSSLTVPNVSVGALGKQTLNTSTTPGMPNSLNTGFVTVGAHFQQIEAQAQSSASTTLANPGQKNAERGNRARPNSQIKVQGTLFDPRLSFAGDRAERDHLANHRAEPSWTAHGDHPIRESGGSDDPLGLVNPNTVSGPAINRPVSRSIPVSLGSHAVRASAIPKRRRLEPEEREAPTSEATGPEGNPHSDFQPSGERVVAHVAEQSKEASCASLLPKATIVAAKLTGRPPQRTLGIRRSMNGWSNRSQRQPFQSEPTG